MIRFTQQNVHLHQLKVWCVIGIHPHERTTEQLLMFDVRFEMDFSRAAASDAIEDALNYSHAAKAIRQFSQQGRFQLLETLIHGLAKHLMQQFPTAEGLWMSVQKPQAIAASQGPGVSVQVARKR